MAVDQKTGRVERVGPNVRSDGSQRVMELVRSLNKTLESTVTAGNSPIVFDYLGDVGFVGVKGWIICDGNVDDPTAKIQVEFSRDGVVYGNPWTMLPGEITNLTGLEVATVRITHLGVDTQFRIWLA